jgi:hypothetical protein
MCQMVAVHSVVFLEMTDHRLDGGAAFEISFDLGRDPALLPRAVHVELVFGRCVVAAISGIGDHALDGIAD